MFPRRLNRVKFAAVLLCGIVCAAQTPSPALRYGGTVGQQRVTMLLEVAGEAVSGGSYSYDRQKGEIRIVDVRQFGTTVVLQDEDGNILHLHSEDAAGEKTGSLQAAALLEGTLNRGELDLPVKLQRLRPSEK